MYISVLKVSHVFNIFMECDFRAVEDGGFVHVIPGEEIRSAALVVIIEELFGPPLSYLRVCKVRPRGGTCNNN